MSTLAAVNETLGEIKGQLIRQNTKLDGYRGAKPMPTSGPKDLTTREKEGTTSAEAAREGLKERAGAKPMGAGIGGLVDKAPNLPISTGNKLLDYAALAGLAVAFNKEIADFLKGFMDGLSKSLRKEIDAFVGGLGDFVDENVTAVATGAAAGLQRTINKLRGGASRAVKGLQADVDRLNKRLFDVENPKVRGSGISRGVSGDDFDQTAGSKNRNPRTTASVDRKSLTQTARGMSPGELRIKGLEVKGGDKAVYDSKSGRIASNNVMQQRLNPQAAANQSGRPTPSPANQNTAPKPTGAVNQKPKTGMLKTFGKNVAKLYNVIKSISGKVGRRILFIVGPIFTVLDSYKIMKTDNDLQTKREMIVREIAGLLVGTAGAIVGAMLGGGMLSWVPGVGTFVGSVIGGIGGYFVGDFLFGNTLANKLMNLLMSDAGANSISMKMLEALDGWLNQVPPYPVNEGTSSYLGEGTLKAKQAKWESAFGSTTSGRAAKAAAGQQSANRTGVDNPKILERIYKEDGKTMDLSNFDYTKEFNFKPGEDPERKKKRLAIFQKQNPGYNAYGQKMPTGPAATTGETSPGEIGAPAASGVNGSPTMRGLTPSPIPEKSAMVNQAARQQASGAGNNITINKAGDTQINQDGGGSGGSPQVVVVKDSGAMPKIAGKIAYGVGLQ